jgi:hypothetical protein
LAAQFLLERLRRRSAPHNLNYRRGVLLIFGNSGSEGRAVILLNNATLEDRHVYPVLEITP